MSNFDEIREWLEKANKDWEPKYKRFNIQKRLSGF